MGRWAQAERRGSFAHSRGMPSVANGNLYADPELNVQFNASGNADFWEAEVFTEEELVVPLAAGNCAGGSRIVRFGVNGVVGLSYNAWVRPWFGGRAGKWSQRWERLVE